ncbi:MAG: hypothetical protein Q9160_007338 [Pyrenula sp. 1 TL-2023]
MGARFERDIANPDGFSALTYTTTNWDDQCFDTSLMRREHSFRDILEPRSIRHRRFFGLGHLVRKFRTLPLEIVQTILNTMDLATLISFRQINAEARALVDSLLSFQVLNKHATDVMQAMLFVGIGSRFTADQVVETLYSENCQFCGSFGGFIYLPRLIRCCFRCVSHDRRALSIPGNQAVDELGLDIDTMRRLPGIQTQPRPSFWSVNSPVPSIWMVDWTAAVEASTTIAAAVTARSSSPALTHQLFRSPAASTGYLRAPRTEWYCKVGEAAFPCRQPSTHIDSIRLNTSRKSLNEKHPSLALPRILHKRLSNPDRHRKTTYPPLPKLPPALLQPITPHLLRYQCLIRAPVLHKPRKGAHHLSHTIDLGLSCLSCRKYWNFQPSLPLTHHSELPMYSSSPPPRQPPNPNPRSSTTNPLSLHHHLPLCPLTHYHHPLLRSLPLSRALHRLVPPPPTHLICRPTWGDGPPEHEDFFRPLKCDRDPRYRRWRERDPCLDGVYGESWAEWAGGGGDGVGVAAHVGRWVARRERIGRRGERGRGVVGTLQDV